MLQNRDGDVTKFKAVCDNCQKEIMVPFEPEPGKPVYCKECLVKIKDGSVAPARGFIAPKAFKKEAMDASPLAALGIEYAPDGMKPTFKQQDPTLASGGKPVFNNMSNSQGKPLHNNYDKNPRPQNFEKKRSGPSPLLKGLLQKIGQENNGEVEGSLPPIIEVKKETPPPMSLSSLKKPVFSPQVPVQPVQKVVLPNKEPSEEKKNMLKDALAKVAPQPHPTPSAVAVDPSPNIGEGEEPKPIPPQPLSTKVTPPKLGGDEKPDSVWQKPQAKKEVPEDVLRKVLEE